MSMLERFFKPENKIVPFVAGDGSLGEIINEVEADFLTKWLDKIERNSFRGKPLSDKERKAILERDGYACSVPHCRTPKYKLQVHHLVWQEFDGSNNPENLATLCLPHHTEAHPGLAQTFVDYKRGDKQAFKRYEEQNKKWQYQPTPRVMDVVVGIIYQKEKLKNK